MYWRRYAKIGASLPRFVLLRFICPQAGASLGQALEPRLLESAGQPGKRFLQAVNQGRQFHKAD
jgi:hypothetical protein